MIGRDAAFNGVGGGAEGMQSSENPLFKISFKSLDSGYEQKNNARKEKSQKFNNGDTVSGKSLDNDNNYTGKIITIKKNEKGEIVFIEILDSKHGKKCKLDPSTVSPKEGMVRSGSPNNDEENPNVSFSAEESFKYILSYDDFIREL